MPSDPNAMRRLGLCCGAGSTCPQRSPTLSESMRDWPVELLGLLGLAMLDLGRIVASC